MKLLNVWGGGIVCGGDVAFLNLIAHHQHCNGSEWKKSACIFLGMNTVTLFSPFSVGLVVMNYSAKCTCTHTHLLTTLSMRI